MAAPRCSATEFLNEHFGEDFDSLSNLDQLYREYKSKEKSLSLAIDQSEKQTSEDLTVVTKICDCMIKDIKETCSKITETLNNFKLHKEETSNMENYLKTAKIDIHALKHRQIYLLFNAKIKSFSNDIKSHTEKKNLPLAMESYCNLQTLCSKLASTTCEKLKQYSLSVCEKHYKELKKMLSSEFDALLIAMKYPFPTGISSPLFSKKEDTESNFRKILLCLAKLKPLSREGDISLVSQLLVKPMVKRFHFHFYGEKHTNNIKKPEWYYTQVINWIRDHEQFYSDYVQTIVDESLDLNIKTQIISELLKLCEEKLAVTLNEVIETDVLLAHYIDETLMFKKELTTLTGTSNGCLQVLLQDVFLEHWLGLEQNFALESMSEMLSNDEAWFPAYADLQVGTDKKRNILYYVPRCVVEFMTLLSLMTTRHKSVNNLNAQQKFLNVLIMNIYSFIIKIKDLASVEVICPESQHYCSILNGVFYIYYVLLEWTDDLYYLQLLKSRHQDGEVSDGSVFTDVMHSLDIFLNALVNSIAEYVKEGLRTKLKAYKAERWHGLPSFKDYIVSVLSNNACDMLLFIKVNLHMLEEKLFFDVFQKVWKHVAKVVDQLIFKEVVFECHFNEGGANQLQFDMTKNLFVIFGQYTPRPESHFKMLNDSCTLLNLLPGSAVLLKAVLEQAEKTSETSEENESAVKTSLQDMGIKHLTSLQASRLVTARVDWPKI
ncbi:RAD50-interacting protein 1-like [Hydractinia symbiolongicarpus]|uniref:RAD50-interacting protein 1-like n=1 Tax=Hydractinia symbiolongicarpus TaxID=13093 RepID=UPI0025502D78|nr:RAD50-interacting protein 1-like [Hydractinia symbiolongicarpus]